MLSPLECRRVTHQTPDEIEMRPVTPLFSSRSTRVPQLLSAVEGRRLNEHT
jgi:hypothetical protein